MKSYVPFIILAIIVLAVGIVILQVIRRAQRFSESVFGTKSLAEGLNRQADLLAETPKSISGMTRIYEPQILEDFPEFNWQEFRQKAEQMLLTAFSAISSGQESQVKGSGDLKEKVLLRIRENKRQGIREVYEQVQIHNTEIARYERQRDSCVITLQSAVGHIYYEEQGGKVIRGDKERKTQTKYNTELMYVQNTELANADRAVGSVCPNCGAPIRGFGQKKCEYCGLAVTPVNIQVWAIQDFYEVNYNKV